MYITALSWSIILLGVLLVLLNIQRGQKLGFVRAAMQLSIIVVSAFVSTFMSDWLSVICEDPAYDLIYSFGLVSSFDSSIGDVSYLINLICEPIGAIILYVPMFFCIYGLLTLIAKAVYDKYVNKDNAKRGDYPDENAPYYVRESKQLGMICGIVSGFVITTVVFSPIAGTIKTCEQVVNLPEEIIGDTSDALDSYTVQRYSNDLMISAVYSMGGRTLFDMTAKLKGSSGRVSIYDELSYLSNEGGEFFNKFQSDITQLDAEALKEIMEYSSDTVIGEALVYCTIRSACNSWRNGNSYYGVPSPLGQPNEPFYNTIWRLLDICSNSSIKNYHANVSTALTVIEQIYEAQGEVGINGYYSKLQLLCDDELISNIEEELKKNKNMNFSLAIDASQIISTISNELIASPDGSYDNMVIYENLENSYNNYAYYPNAERLDLMSADVVNVFANANMPIPEAASRELCEQLINRFGYYISYFDISNFFYDYYNGYYYKVELNYNN